LELQHGWTTYFGDALALGLYLTHKMRGKKTMYVVNNENKCQDASCGKTNNNFKSSLYVQKISHILNMILCYDWGWWELRK
jgi:hypothetical protein